MEQSQCLEILHTVAIECYVQDMSQGVDIWVHTPEPIEVETQKCLRAGILENTVQQTINAAWQTALHRFPARKDIP